jgi:tetratricopeptide (TPR) repeat protein
MRAFYPKHITTKLEVAAFNFIEENKIMHAVIGGKSLSGTIRNLLFLILIFSTSFSVKAAAVKVDSVFESANKAYMVKNYSAAIEQYELIINNGFRSAELYFNLGNAFFKTGNYPKAILCYEKAKLIDPENSDIEFNLTKARTYVIDKIEVIPDFFIKAWFRSLVSKLSPNSWAALSAILFILFSLLILLYLFVVKVNLKKLAFYLGLFSLFISINALIFAFKTRAYIDNSNIAIIMSPTVSVKTSPDNESTNAFIIHEGTKVYILRSLNGWNEIKLSDGKQGWLESNTIEKI